MVHGVCDVVFMVWMLQLQDGMFFEVSQTREIRSEVTNTASYHTLLPRCASLPSVWMQIMNEQSFFQPLQRFRSDPHRA
jgi:hypothetical protein